MEEVKEWVKYSAAPRRWTVSVTLQAGNVTVRYSAAAYPSQLKKGVKEARDGARAALHELQEALRELDDEEEAA